MKNKEILKIALVRSGISQVEAANRFKLALSTVHRQCKSENPTFSTIQKYAELCGIKPSELIALSE